MLEGLNIYRRPKLKEPYLIVAWPGMGDVAFKAAFYLIDKLKMQDFAEIPPQDFFYLTGSTIQQGVLDLPELPAGKFYYWKNPATKIDGDGQSDLVVFVSNAQPDLAKAQDYCQRIIALARMFKVKMIISFAALPQALDHTQEASVWYSATSKELTEHLKEYNLKLLSEGQISGMNGLFLGIAKKEGFKGFCLLGEIPLYTIQIENPKASYALLEALSRILKIQIDSQPLLEQAKDMEAQINKLFDYLKLTPPAATPISEEEIEKIKKSLSQLTKLPVSVKEKIEKLFQDAKNDIMKARDLKTELDRWNVYKEYEDRFLDLFKKTKDKNN